jgi:hypothetical protein
MNYYFDFLFNIIDNWFTLVMISMKYNQLHMDPAGLY